MFQSWNGTWIPSRRCSVLRSGCKTCRTGISHERLQYIVSSIERLVTRRSYGTQNSNRSTKKSKKLSIFYSCRIFRKCSNPRFRRKVTPQLSITSLGWAQSLRIVVGVVEELSVPMPGDPEILWRDHQGKLRPHRSVLKLIFLTAHEDPHEPLHSMSCPILHLSQLYSTRIRTSKSRWRWWGRF